MNWMEEKLVDKEQMKSPGLSGSTLKIIAMISMFIDHATSVLLERYIVYRGMSFDLTQSTGPKSLIILDLILRGMGRLAFPIFIFLLVQGFEHTRNKWKYLFRLVLFAGISEIPFDLGLGFHYGMKLADIKKGQIINFDYQNVFFTLAVGLFTIILLDKIKKLNLPKGLIYLYGFLAAFLGMALAWFLKTDYGMVGVLAIIVMYLYKDKGLNGIFLTCLALLLSSISEACAFLVVWPVSKYNGKRGLNLKYVFYAFYPVHFLVLWLIALVLGIVA